MNFSEKLKEIRKNEGLSQEQLAEKIGVSRQAITKWETGRGLPDIENMVILAEIFKTTIDELVTESKTRSAKQSGFVSETAYDIDSNKHFDINIGSANSVYISSGTDEKVHVILHSETAENIGEIFKIKLDERKNRLDLDCVHRDKMSRFEALEQLEAEIILPRKFAEQCEVAASAKVLEINNLNIKRLEFDGAAEQIFIEKSEGRFEFTSKNDFEITADRINGEVEVYQFHAKTLLHVSAKNCPRVENKGRRCSVYFMKNGERAEFIEPSADGGAVIAAGIGSELILDVSG